MQRTILILIRTLILFALLATNTAPAADLESAIEQRVSGDRSGVCLAVVRLADTDETAFRCADQASGRTLDARSRFEIGSLSKALQGLLVARLAEQDVLAIDEPVADLLPDGASVPEFEGEPIRLIHLLTHTSGLPRLPSDFEIDDPANPYAGYDPDDLLAHLAEAEPASAPGEQFVYSNFGAMVLSLALVERTGMPLPELFESEIFAPLGMDDTSMSGPTVQGHSSTGQAVPNWDFHADLGGVGAIRSTPADLQRWLDALLGDDEGPLANALARSREVLVETGGRRIGYGWMHVPLGERLVMIHDGGTGGFSSFTAVDTERGRASVLLMDTSMIDQNSLADLALHLVDDSHPLQSPRMTAALPAGVSADDYVGRYAIYQGEQRFMGDFVLEVTADGDQVFVQGSAGGQTQPEFAVDSDGKDRFVQPALGLAVEFRRDQGGRVSGLILEQAGMTLRGEPL